MTTFPTPAPISATIDLLSGDIRVVASYRTDTVVSVRPRNESRSRDTKAVAQTRVDFTDGRLTVKSPKPLQTFLGGPAAHVDVTIELPTGSHIRATTMDGDILVEGRSGDCSLKTYDGDITVHEAESLHMTTLDGELRADRVIADAHVTASGDLQITEVGGNAYVKNLNGPSWIGQVGGEVRVNSAHGDIVIDRPGPRVVARTAHGGVRLGDVSRGSVVLQTASGEVEVGIRAGTAAWLDVQSSSGRIRNELDSSGGPQGQDETAQVRARTWDGDIIIRRAA